MGIDAQILVRGVSNDTVTDDWLREMSWQLGRSIGAEKFFLSADDGRMAIEKTNSRYAETEEPPGSVYYEDADEPIRANRGECLLEVNLWTRYYGIGYERGDLLTLCAIAEWLEYNIPGCEVWYGGDSSGVCAMPWPDDERRKLREHLYGEGGRQYFRSWCKRDEYGLPPACSLCPGGEYRGWRGGVGNNFASFNCGGCGKTVETRDGGQTWNERKNGH